jgi:hypothetical protein
MRALVQPCRFSWMTAAGKFAAPVPSGPGVEQVNRGITWAEVSPAHTGQLSAGAAHSSEMIAL